MLKDITYWQTEWQDQNVQPDEIPDGKNYLSSESMVVCSIVSPTAITIPGAQWIPIGIVENIGLNQRKQFARLFEVGSKRSIGIPGRTMKTMQLTRMMFNGASLMKAASLSSEEKGRFEDIWGTAFTSGTPPTEPFDATNSGNFFINLASHFFNRPINLGLVIHDSENDHYGAAAFRDCSIVAHNMTITGQQTVVMENISIDIDDIIPINYGTTTPRFSVS